MNALSGAAIFVVQTLVSLYLAIVLLRFVLQLVNERGQVDAADVQALRDQGVNDEQIVEIVAHVALNLFTNYVNVAFDVPVDFPKVALR